MAIFLDSASVEDAKQAARLGFVHGATTNPILLAKAGASAPETLIRELSDLFQGPVFYQLISEDAESMVTEARKFLQLAPNVGIKILCTHEGCRAAAEISKIGTVGITGVYTPSQAYVARETGADYVIPYFSRISHYIGNAVPVMEEIAALLRDSPIEILAASIKSPTEAVAAILAGASHVSAPLAVIYQMIENDLTEIARKDFNARTD